MPWFRASALLVVHRQQGSDERAECRLDVEDPEPGELRRVSDATVLDLPACKRLEDRVETRAVGAIAVLSVARHVTEDDVRVDRAQAGLVDAELRCCLRSLVVVDDVGPFDELTQNLSARLGGEIDR